jgi:hypothetical protein
VHIGAVSGQKITRVESKILIGKTQMALRGYAFESPRQSRRNQFGFLFHSVIGPSDRDNKGETTNPWFKVLPIQWLCTPLASKHASSTMVISAQINASQSGKNWMKLKSWMRESGPASVFAFELASRMHGMQSRLIKPWEIS